MLFIHEKNHLFRFASLAVKILLCLLLMYCDDAKVDLQNVSEVEIESIQVADDVLKKVAKYPADKTDTIAYLLHFADSIYRQYEHTDGMARVLLCKANFAVHKIDYKAAIGFADSIFLLPLKEIEPVSQTSAHKIKGYCFTVMGVDSEALKEFQATLEIATAGQDSSKMITALSNIAYCLNEVGDDDNARKHLHRSLLLAKAINADWERARIYFSLGRTFSKSLNSVDSSRYYLQLAYKVADAHGYSNLFDPIAITTAKMNVLEEKYQAVLKPMQRILNRYPDQARSESVVDANYILGVASYKSGHPEAAYQYLNQGIELSETIHDSKLIITGLKHITEYYRHIDNYEKADEYRKITNDLEKETTGVEIKYRLNDLRAQAALQNKERKIASLHLAQLEREKKFRSFKNRLFLFSLLCIIILVIVYIGGQQRTKSQTARREQLIAESNLEILRSQMNPHFIFNAFVGIQNFILKSDKIEAYNYIGKFAGLLRKVMDNAKDTFIPIEQEVEILRNYLEMEQMRFRKSFIAEVTVDTAIKDREARIPSMMIQPFVENAIIHGLSSIKEGGKIKVSFKAYENGVKVIVADNGIGRVESAALKDTHNHLSIATNNGQKRLEFLREIGYSNASIEIEDIYNDSKQPNGTRVIIYLPLHQ